MRISLCYRIGLLLLLPAIHGAVANAATYYVANGGDDGQAGDLDHPWEHIQTALERAVAGDTILVRGGSYQEQLDAVNSGDATSGSLTLKNYVGETAVIDGVAATDLDEPLLEIFGVQYLRIEGLTFRNLKTGQLAPTPIGIYIYGASHHIEIVDCFIAEIENTHANGNAHALAVYGERSDAAIHDITIRGNEIHDCLLGNSEALVLNGNVEQFLIEGNTIHDVNNIGIDLIGHEGVCSDPTLDQARNGVCRSNHVYNIDTMLNPSYGDPSAAGIYIDGGKDLVIERNRTHDNNFGVEIASEHQGKSSSGVILRSNLIYRNHIGGLFMGGYDSVRGSATGNSIVNNTFYQNGVREADWESGFGGEIVLQYYCSENIFHNNLIQALASHLFLRYENATGANNTFSHNQYFIAGASPTHRWQWENQVYTDLASFNAASGQGSHSFIADPLFINPANEFFNIPASSMAVDAGITLSASIVGALDFAGNNRFQGQHIDIGAFEAPPFEPTASIRINFDRYNNEN